jgi:CRP-like cAMP-binding protein
MSLENIKQKIQKELLNPFVGSREKYAAASSELAYAFQPLPPMGRGDFLWRDGSQSPFLFFLEHGALVETDSKGVHTSMIRLVSPGTLFWCEDVVFYNQGACTQVKSLTNSTVWSLSQEEFYRIQSEFGSGFDFLNALSLVTLRNYRSRTAQLIQMNPEKRLAHALGQYPALLSLLTRDELANFLAVSRSTLHRVLKQGYGR